MPARLAQVALTAVVGAIIVAVVAPLLVLLGVVTGLPGAPSLTTLSAVLLPANLAALAQTTLIALGAVVVAVVVGVPIAVAVERTDVGASAALGAIATVPLAVPSYLLAFAFRAAFDDRIGLLSFVDVIGDIDSAAGIALVLGVSLLPIVVLRLRASLAGIDGALEEAARTAGAGPLRAVVDVTMPLCLPSVTSSAALVFAGAAAAFGVPMVLGLAADVPVVVVTTRITIALQSGSPTAVADALSLSVALTALTAVAFALPVLIRRVRRRQHHGVVGSRPARPTTLALGPWRGPITVVLWGVVVAVVVVPLVALVLQGLTRHAGRPLSIGNMSFQHVVDVVSPAEVRSAATTSLLLALGAAAIVVAVAVVVVVVRRRSRGASAVVLSAVGRLVEMAYALPGTVVAVALVLTFSAEVRLVVLEQITFVLALGSTTALLMLAYVIKEAALGFRAVDEALDRQPAAQQEAARLAGAGPTRAFVDVTLPVVRPHLVAAAVVVFLPAFTELTMSVLLQAPGTSTLGVVLFSLYEYGDPQEAMALAAVLVGLALGGQLLILRLGR